MHYRDAAKGLLLEKLQEPFDTFDYVPINSECMLFSSLIAFTTPVLQKNTAYITFCKARFFFGVVKMVCFIFSYDIGNNPMSKYPNILKSPGFAC